MIGVLARLFCLVVATAAAAEPQAMAAVNAIRADAGRAALAPSDRLDAIAAAHAADIARRGVVTHQAADGSGPGARARAGGYRYCRIAENVAQGYASLGAVVDAWQGSPKHRRNMLDPRVTEMGLARAEGDYWVMILARPGC